MPSNVYKVTIQTELDTSGIKSGARQTDDVFAQLANKAKAAGTNAGEAFRNSSTQQARLTVAELKGIYGNSLSDLVRTAKVGQAEVSKAMAEERARGAAKALADEKQQTAAVISLQRQRSSALIREAQNAARGISQSTQAFDAELQRIGNLGKNTFLELTSAMGLTEQEAAQLSVAIPAVGAALLVAGGFIVGATVKLFELTKGAAEFGAKLTDLSQRTGISVQTLSTLKIAFDLSGGSIESGNTALGRYLQTVSDANHKNEEAAKKLRQVGIDYKQAFTSPDEAVRLLIERISTLTNEEDRLNALRKVGVRNGQELNGAITEINKTFGSYIQLQKTARELGLAITPEQAEEAKKFENSLTLLELQFKAAGYTIGREFMPDFQRAITTISQWLLENKDEIRAWASYVHDAVKEGYEYVVLLKDIADVAGTVASPLLAILNVIKDYPAIVGDALVALTPFLKALQLLKQVHDYFKEPAAPTTFDYTDPAARARAQSGLSTGTGPALPVLLGDKEKKQTGADPADKLIEKLRSDTERINRVASDALSTLATQFREGYVGIAEYVKDSETLEINRSRDALATLEAERTAAYSKRKDSADAVAKIDNQIIEEHSKHLKEMARLANEAAKERAEITKRAAQNELDVQREGDQRSIEALKYAADNRQITYAEAEKKIAQIQVAALLREDAYYATQQKLYAADSVQYQEYANKRALIIQGLGAISEQYARDSVTATRQDVDNVRTATDEINRVLNENAQRRQDISSRTIDIQESLGVGADNTRALRAQLSAQQENDRYQFEQQQMASARAVALQKKTDEEKAKINAAYDQAEILAGQEHEQIMQQIMLEPLIAYAQKVAEIAGQVGDIFGTAFADIGQHGKSFFADLKQGFNNLWQSLIHDFIQSRVKQIIESLFNPTAGATQTGGGGFSLGNIFGSILNIFRPGAIGPGGTAPFNPNAGMSFGDALAGGLLGNSQLSALLGAGITPPMSATAQATQTAAQGALGASIAHALGIGGGAATTVAQGFSLAGFGSAIAPLLPFAGLGLGASLGSPSGLGSILGGAGGLLLGGAGLAALAPGVLAGILGGGSVSILGPAGAAISTTYGGLGGAAIGFLTNPFTIAAGAALIAGALILGRNAQRRRDEQTRDSLATDLRTQVYQLISQVQSDQMDGAQALAQYWALRGQYVDQVNQTIHDSKTKRNALLWLNDLDSQVLPKLQQAVDAQTSRHAIAGQLHETFSTSVTSFASGGFVGRVPGLFNARDDRLIRVSGDEVVLNPSQWRPITPYLKAANVPGFAAGGAVVGSAGAGDTHVTVNIYPDNTARVEIDSPLLKQKIVQTVRANIYERPSDIPGDIQEANRRSGR
jgi:hypothetical protein